MTDMKRIADKYAGKNTSDFTSDELHEYLTGVAQEGAMNALISVGLGDDGAGQDIKDVRALLSGYRVIKKNAMATSLAFIGRGIGAAIILLFAMMFLKGKFAQEVVDLIK